MMKHVIIISVGNTIFLVSVNILKTGVEVKRPR